MTTRFKIDVDCDKLPIVQVNWYPPSTMSRIGGGYVKGYHCVFIFPCSSKEDAIRLLEHHRLTVKGVENTKRPTLTMIEDIDNDLKGKVIVSASRWAEIKKQLKDNKLCAYCNLSKRGICKEGDYDCLALEKLKSWLKMTEYFLCEWVENPQYNPSISSSTKMVRGTIHHFWNVEDAWIYVIEHKIEYFALCKGECIIDET